MILTNGPFTELAGKDWYTLEFGNDLTIEPVLHRLATALAGIFRDSPAELFVPLGNRDLGIYELKTGVYVFIRGDLKLVKRLHCVCGLAGLVSRQVKTISRFIVSTDAEVQPMIAACAADIAARVAAIKLGSFVRILAGRNRDYCGTVMSMDDSCAVVSVELFTFTMMIETPLGNLLSLGDVPEDKRVFYFCPSVAALEENPPNDTSVTATFEQKEEEEVKTAVGTFNRAHTIVGIARRMVAAGQHKPRPIAEAVMAAIKAGELRRPKNLFIPAYMIKLTLFTKYFKPRFPEMKTYRAVIAKYGGEYRLTAETMVSIDPTTDIPLDTVEPAKDGRSREARRAKKLLTATSTTA
jgi:hypothetical protein